MGLAGESGCGKSTLGNSLIFMEGRMKVIGGTVELDGKPLPISDSKAMNDFRLREVSHHPPVRHERAEPDQEDRPHGQRPAQVPGGPLTTRVLEEFERRIALVGLPENVLGMYPFELSGGMRQRVTMVISTLLNPSLLIADEVTSALGRLHAARSGRDVDGVPGPRFVKSMIVITHDLSILAQIADSILIMYAGKLAEKARRRNRHRPAPPPLHPAAAGVAARGRCALRGRRPRRDPGPAAVAARPAHRVPLPGPLPVRLRQVRRGPAVRRAEAGPPGGVLEGDGDVGHSRSVRRQEAGR